MDIHAPEGPIRSLKEFAVHILVVTIGILIAFGLEGFRETWRENNAVSEARESFEQELRLNQKQLRTETANVKQVNAEVDHLLEDLPKLSKKPKELTKRALALGPSFYFFRTTAWESATASGILAKMKTEEVNRFADAYLGTKNYQDAQKGAIPVWISIVSYFQSHHRFSRSDLVTGEEKLRTFQKAMQIMDHLAGEFDAGLTQAIGQEKPPPATQ